MCANWARISLSQGGDEARFTSTWGVHLFRTDGSSEVDVMMPSRIRIPWRFLCTAAFCIAFAAACDGGVVSIGSLLGDPGRYDGKVVRIVGEVEGAVGFLGYGMYQVDDGTATITVVSERQGAPRSGTRLRVEGEFKAAFTIGAETVGVLLERRRQAL